MRTTQNIFDKIAFYLVLGVLFLAPTFFVPSSVISFDTGKSVLIIFLSLTAFFIWLIGRLKDGHYSFPKSWFYASSFLLLAVYGLATAFSPNTHISFFGQGLSIGSFAFIAPVLILSFLIPELFTNEKKIFYAYSALFISFAVVALYEIIKLATGAFSFGVLTSTTSNLVGGWNDLAIFGGLVAILSMIALDTLELSKMLKCFLYIFLVLSAVFVACAGFFELWIILAVISLIFFIYQLSFKKSVRGDGKNIAFHTLAIVLISIFLVFGGTMLSSAFGKIVNVQQIEVRPSWNATMSITEASLSNHPLFGAGPERFSYEWLLHKPAGVNSTIFWDTNFNYGVGFLPTLAVTLGVFGIAAFLAYLILLLVSSAKAFVVQAKTNLGTYFLLTSISGACYLWAIVFVYVPGAAMLTIAFAFSGILVATLISQGAVEALEFSTIDKPARSFVSVLLAVLLLIALAAFGYAVFKNTLASFYFGEAGTAATASNADLAVSRIQTALTLSPDPSYDRALADIYLSEINVLLNNSQPNQTDAVQKLQSLLASAISAGEAAVSLDPKDYQNYLELGSVYATVVPLKVTGAYDAAKAAFGQAQVLNPQDPEIDLLDAELEIANGNNTTAAEIDINAALTKKNDYADAIFLLSQIEVSQGKVALAINAVKAVAELSPNNPGVFFQLGLLEYSQKDYQDAIQALNQALLLSPQYANAKYFLGLSDYYNGDVTGAIAQFTDLANTNPTNTIVAAALANLKAAKDPFAGQKTAEPQVLPVSQ